MERAPIYNAYWSDGRFADGKDGDNPIAEHQLGGSMKKQNYSVGGKLQLDITPIEGLTLTAIVAPKYLFTKEKTIAKDTKSTGSPVTRFPELAMLQLVSVKVVTTTIA